MNCLYLSYSSITMFKLLRFVLTAFILLFWINGNCQPPVVVVPSFEYIWARYGNHDIDCIVLAKDESSKLSIQNSFAKAFESYWHVIPADLALNVKHLSMFTMSPKFKTAIKNKEGGPWYLFLQIYDNTKFEYRYYENDELTNTLQVKCRLVNSNDSVILEKDMAVDLYEKLPPYDQVILKRLNAYPASFLKAFDSIATWLFQPAPVSSRSITLQPACIYQPKQVTAKPVAAYVFKNDNDTITSLTGSIPALHPGAIKYEQTETKRNIGGNALSSTLTILTGLQSNKSRFYFYKADIPFEENGSGYHCYINYVEKQTKQVERVKNDDRSFSTRSKDYELLGRFIDPDTKCLITNGNDTLATFAIEYGDAGQDYNQLWDGSDSTTIIPLPSEWKNKNSEVNITINGNIGNATFLMKAENQFVKQFYLDGKLVAIFYGKSKPLKADIYRKLLPGQLTIFTMLCSLPYPYFNQKY